MTRDRFYLPKDLLLLPPRLPQIRGPLYAEIRALALIRLEIEPEQLAHRDFVRWRKWVLVELGAMNPLESLHVADCRSTFGQRAVVEIQVNHVVVIGVTDETD